MNTKNALVTGASSGIGYATALALAKEGYNVGVNYNNNVEGALELCSRISEIGRKALPLQADVREVKNINSMFERFVEEFGHIDLLVNNAGITKYEPLLEASEKLWDDITYTDWKASYFCTQRAAQNMVANQIQGVIINITSIHSDCCFPISNIYAPTKAALTKFTKQAALELAKYGIRVVAVAPGCTQIREGESDTPRGKMLASRIPLQRYGRPDEVCDAIVFLASDKASYITGTSLTVDGGSLLPTILDNTYTENPFLRGEKI